MEIWTYVFITTRHPKRTLPQVRQIASAHPRRCSLSGSPDIVVDDASDLAHLGSAQELVRPKARDLFR